MISSRVAQTWWWLIHKDLVREIRAPRTLPAMLLLGIIIALIIPMQVDIPIDQRRNLVASLFWLAVFFAGVVALDRSFAGEREEGCWPGLLRYPVAPGTVFLAKTTSNFLALVGMQCVLVPAIGLFFDVSLITRPLPFVGVLIVANLGFASMGTLLSALTSGIRARGSLLTLLLLPLLSPVMVGASQATHALLVGHTEEAWRWGQLLACFALLFTTLGTLVFEFVIED